MTPYEQGYIRTLTQFGAEKIADIILSDKDGKVVKQQRAIDRPDGKGSGLETVYDVEGIGVPGSYMGDDYQRFPLRLDDEVREILSVRPDAAHHLWEAPEDTSGLQGQLDYLIENAPKDSWRIWNSPYGKPVSHR